MFLIAIGLPTSRRLTTRTWAGALIRVLAALAAAAMCGLWHPGDLLLIGLVAASVRQWGAGHAERVRPQATGTLVLFMAVIAALGCSPDGSPVAGTGTSLVAVS